MSRSWIRLFKMVDEDNSGQISFTELVALIRNELGLPPANVPEVLLKSVWIALDTDCRQKIRPLPKQATAPPPLLHLEKPSPPQTSHSPSSYTTAATFLRGSLGSSCGWGRTSCGMKVQVSL